jgi:hypothetical protein
VLLSFCIVNIKSSHLPYMWYNCWKKCLFSCNYIYCLLLTIKLHFHLWWKVFSPSCVDVAFCCLICVVCMARAQFHFVLWCCHTGVNAATLTQVLSLLLPSCLHLVSQETSLLQVPLLYHCAFFIPNLQAWKKACCLLHVFPGFEICLLLDSNTQQLHSQSLLSCNSSQLWRRSLFSTVKSGNTGHPN